jgi:hypothetical protein
MLENISNPLSKHLAKHIRDVHTGGNWTDSNLKDQLQGITWQQATTKVNSFNTILALVYHMHYFVHAALDVLHGKPLDAHDKFSFDHPPVQSQVDWNKFVDKVFKEAEEFASLVEQMPDNKMWENFSDEKYGNWYRNLTGIIEHMHYHLGQVALLKKMVVVKDE